jgi:hypothetical protein
VKAGVTETSTIAVPLISLISKPFGATTTSIEFVIDPNVNEDCNPDNVTAPLIEKVTEPILDVIERPVTLTVSSARFPHSPSPQDLAPQPVARD